MCGISGIFSPEKKINSGIIATMTNELNHRGPDEDGYYQNEFYHCGHKRLKIIALDSGQQPMKSNDGRYVLVYNGELYNYKELRSQLEKNKVIFNSESDTEVLLKMYEYYGSRCIKYFNGMFAFAIFDTIDKQLFIARDRVGIKPLYIYNKNGVFLFASELKAILKYSQLDKKLDYNYINEYFTWRHSISDITPFKYVKKFPAGHHAIINVNMDIKLEKYWELDWSSNDLVSESEIIKKMEMELNNSVARRMISDVPVGVFLSGGLDSSSIAYYMSKNSSKPINTFTVGFNEDSKYDETQYGKRVAEHIGSNHHEINVEPSSINILEKIIYHMDEPIGDPAIVPTFLMSEKAKQEVTVILSGEGSDEVNGGYEKYLRYYLLNEHPVLKHLKKISNFPFNFGRAGRLIKNSTYPAEYFNLNLMPFHNETKNLLRKPTNYLPSKDYGQTSIDLMAFDFNTWLKNDLLVKVDRMSMAHALEVRVPFLDHNYEELLFKVKSSKKFKNIGTKSLLRKMMSGKLPSTITSRRQHGFNVPLDKWFKDNVFIKNELLSESKIKNYGIIIWNYVKKILDEQNTGKVDHGLQLWMIIVFHRWMEQI